MKVAELEGAQLDAWVARALGKDRVSVSDGRAYREVEIALLKPGFAMHGVLPEYSKDWAQGGPIIEREGISLLQIGIGESGSKWSANFETWYEDREDLWVGATPLIAAMRAFVASKYGENVPDE